MNDMRAQREFFYHKSAGKEYHPDTRKPAFFYTGTGDVGERQKWGDRAGAFTGIDEWYSREQEDSHALPMTKQGRRAVMF